MLQLIGRRTNLYTNPASITGLIAWFDAQTNITAASINSGVDAAANLAPTQTIGMTGTAPNRPTWYDQGFRNYKMSFEAQNPGTDYLTCTKRVCASGFSAHITFKNWSPITTAPANPTINPSNCLLSDSGASCWNTLGLNGNNVEYHYATGGVWTTYASSGLSLANGVTHTIGVTHSTAGALKVWADGVAVVSTTGITYDTANTGFSCIMAGYNFDAIFSAGGVAEVMVFNAAVTDANMLALHNRGIAFYG